MKVHNIGAKFSSLPESRKIQAGVLCSSFLSICLVVLLRVPFLMPGTIRVSVLEFKGFPSTFLKVSLGKKEYQTSDVGNFSFPLTSLRDNLVVTVQNTEGNETTLTVIQTMSIVEKVCWNDTFYLAGGGLVRLQLEFILSDEERNRIRSMREAALKKKQGGAPNVISRQSEIASSESDSVMSSPQAKQMVSASSQEASSESGYLGSEVAAKTSSVSPEDDRVDEPEKQGPLEKTSSKVRKLVGAFETSLVQAPLKLSAIKPEEKKVMKGGYLKDFDYKNLPEAVESLSGRRMKLLVAGDSKAAGKREEKIDSGRNSVRNIISQATNRFSQSTSEATESRILDSSSTEGTKLSVDMESPSTVESVGISGRAYSFGMSTEQQESSSGTSSYVEGRSKNDLAEISVQVASSIGKPKSLEYREEEHFHFENPGMWIFPNDRNRLCITTAGKSVMNLLGSHNAAPRSYQKNRSSAASAGHADKISSAQPGNEHKKTQNVRDSRSESSSSDAYGGLVQQAIKAAIVVGFGVLVFLTRQREPRKRNKDTEELLFEASEYSDEQILTGEKI